MSECTGYLQMVCGKREGKTILKDAYFYGAFKVTRPVYLDDSGQACVYVMNPGGGYLDGDVYEIEVYLEPGAEVLLTTQSSTKIYKSLMLPAVQETDIVLQEGSYLEYLPDPTIAYQHARFKQKTVVHMDNDAAFVFTDILTPGWAPDGSWFRYDLLQSRLEVYKDGEVVLHDHVKLQPDADIQEMGSLEGYSHLGSMVVIHEQVTDEFLHHFDEIIQTSQEDVRIGWSMLIIPGFTLRILAHRTQDIEKIFSLCLTLVRERQFGNKPVFLRKY